MPIVIVGNKKGVGEVKHGYNYVFGDHAVETSNVVAWSEILAMIGTVCDHEREPRVSVNAAIRCSIDGDPLLSWSSKGFLWSVVIVGAAL